MATPPDFTTGQVLTAAQMNAVGLWKMTPTSVVNGTIQTNGDVTWSAQSTISLNGVFTDDFVNYRIVISNLTISTSASNLQMRLRASGTDAAGASDYVLAGYEVRSTGASGIGGTTGDSSWFMVRINNAADSLSATSIDIFQPKEAIRTLTNGIQTYYVGGTDVRAQYVAGAHKLATAYDGFTLYLLANTGAGRVSVYGYN